MAMNDVFRKEFLRKESTTTIQSDRLRNSIHRIILPNRPNQPIQPYKTILSRDDNYSSPLCQKRARSILESVSGIQRRSLISETTMDRPLPGTQSAVHNLRMPRRRRISH